ncbi:MAG: lipoate--protein ligase family protein, partial [Burkholderiales bacterium]
MTAGGGIAGDSGLRAGPENIRLDRGQWQAARHAASPVCRVRFHRYLPGVALGAFETPGHALRAEYCRHNKIDVVRRVSGGGAIYLDPDQPCWTLTLTLTRAAPAQIMSLAEWMARLAGGVANGLRRLGVEAVFVAPNDIEVAGRKLGCGFIALADDAVLFQGSILTDLDTETMMKALRVPTEKLSPQGLRSARHRFITLRELGVSAAPAVLQRYLLEGWADELGLSFAREVPGEMVVIAGADEAPPAEDWDAQAVDWDQAFVKTAHAVLHARLRLSRDGQVLQRAEFAGNVHVHPLNLFSALSSTLAMVPVAELDATLDDFFRRQAHAMLELAPTDVRRVLRLALDRRMQRIQFALTGVQANSLMVHAPSHQAAATIAQQASVMLVPYCAKPVWCKWRQRDGCPECGRCEVGDAYRLGRERGMRVITITNFEHLEQTLGGLRADGTRAYVGMCCRHFFIKREYAFRAAGMPALLMVIAGANCYELQQEYMA